METNKLFGQAQKKLKQAYCISRQEIKTSLTKAVKFEPQGRFIFMACSISLLYSN
jgi:hypothetical protein